MVFLKDEWKKMNILEDKDPFEINSWHDFAKDCIAAGKINILLNKLSEYVDISHRFYRKKLHLYYHYLKSKEIESKMLEERLNARSSSTDSNAQV